MKRARPMRTCVGCRAVVPQDTVVRVVVDRAGRAVIDEARRLSGRGAWVHRVRSCVEGAARGGLARSFRRKVDPNLLISQLLGETLSPLATGSETS